MRKLNKVDSNRGGALLSVIIVMTVVGILGALVLSISYTNFRMKQIDKKSKDNFYSAEAVLDEIFVGLQGEVSEQYKNAYTTIMENYGSYSSSLEMSKDFNVEFVLNMVEILKKSESDREHYDFDKVKSYVNLSNYPSDHSFTITSTDSLLDTLEDGLCIRNLCVTYTNDGYVNTITTDIKISTPVVEFARISTMPEIADYVMIAQDGMETEEGAHWSLQGKGFAGSGIELKAGSTLDANNTAATLLVTEGDISMVAASKFSTGATTSLWANSVNASYNKTSQNNSQKIASNQISLLGRSYIKDDTTLNGSGNELTLSGQYYGYSNDDRDASKSSAIIVNGSDTLLDMSGLKSLVVAGTSFVATKAPVVEGTPTAEQQKAAAMNTANVLMGDSVAVKSNQIAYMVPTECKGIASNPMTYEQYETLLENNPNWEEEALGTVLSTLRRSLASYGNISIQPIYSSRDGGCVYFYLSFSDSDVASKYFMDYYGSSGGAKLKSYLERYITTFEFNTTDMNRLVTQGNYLVPAGNERMTYTDNTGDVATSAQELSNYQASYEALCAKLVENKSSLSSTELNQTVYENLIDQNTAKTGKLDEFLTACAENTVNKWSDNISYSKANGIEVATIWANAQDKTNNTGVRCIIVDNDDAEDLAYSVPVGSGIIIATGDVALNGSGVVWNGLIISNGRMFLSGGSSTNMGLLRADGNTTAKAMQYVCSVGTDAVSETTPDNNHSVMSFFIGGGEFSMGASSDADGAKVDVRNCLSFENWKSE